MNAEALHIILFCREGCNDLSYLSLNIEAFNVVVLSRLGGEYHGYCEIRTWYNSDESA